VGPSGRASLFSNALHVPSKPWVSHCLESWYQSSLIASQSHHFHYYFFFSGRSAVSVTNSSLGRVLI